MNAARQSPSSWFGALIGVFINLAAGQSARDKYDPANPKQEDRELACCFGSVKNRVEKRLCVSSSCFR